MLMNIAMAAFTVNDTAMKFTFGHLPMFESIALRGALATLLLLLLCLRLRAFSIVIPARDQRLLAIRTLAEVISTLTFLAALAHMAIANVSAIMQAIPLALALAAAVFLREPIGWRRLVAIIIGFIGVLVIIRPGPEGFDIWSLVVLASVVFVVWRDLTTRRMAHGLPSALVALIASVAVTIVGFAGTLLAEDWVTPRGSDLLALCLAAFALLLGYITVVGAMRVGEIGIVSPFRYTALLWAILLGWLVFDQFPDRFTLLGSGVVVASGLFTLWREQRARRALRP